MPHLAAPLRLWVGWWEISLGGGGGHAQTNTLTGTILPPPGWADLTWEPGNGSLRGAQRYCWAEEGKGKGDSWLCWCASSLVGFHSLYMSVCGCVNVYTYLISPLIFLRVLTFDHTFNLCFDVGSPKGDDSSFHKPFYLLSPPTPPTPHLSLSPIIYL